MFRHHIVSAQRASARGFTWRLLAIFLAIVAIGVVIIDWQADHRLLPLFAFAFPRNSVVAGQPSTITATALFWEVGVGAGPDDRNVTAMRTTIRTVKPRHIATGTTDFFWIGSYLADGSFVQVGYAETWSDRSAHWFYCSFGPGGASGPCKIGPSSSAGATGQMHTYALVANPGNQSGQWEWVATLDGKTIGSMLLSAGSTGSSVPGVDVEQSAFVATAPVNDLGPAEFSPAIAISQASAGATPHYSAPQHAFATASSTECSGYGVSVLHSNAVEIGSQLPCLPFGQSLW